MLSGTFGRTGGLKIPRYIAQNDLTKAVWNINLSTSARLRSSSALESEYLHKSILPTDAFQASLIRLPIPALEKTCQRYLNSQEAVLDPAAFQRTSEIVKRFQEVEGKGLHEKLVAKDKAHKHTSYISEPWFDMYLKARVPIVLNFNPFMTFNDDPKEGYNQQLIRSTNMIVASMMFMKTLRAGYLDPDVYHLNPKKSDTESFRKIMKYIPNKFRWYGAYAYKAFPLDMSQYPRLFNSTRIPRIGKDELFTDTSARHLLVMRNGHMYTFDVLDKNGMIVSPTEIMSHLQYILSDTRPPPDYPLGYLTAENRDTWAVVRDKLLDAGNTEQLKMVDSAVFALILDDDIPKDPIEVSRLHLHGNGANRWFDKSFSLIMTKDGKTCVNFEHAWGDGVAVLRYFNEVFKLTTEKPFVHPDTQPANVDSAAAVKKIEFHLGDNLKQAISEAKSRFDHLVNSLDLGFTTTEKFGKNLIKEKKLSPDAIMQLSFQMAFYKQYGKTVPTYESCSTAAFKHGRTETIRSATMATKKTCEMFEKTGNRPSVSELQGMLKACSDKHGQLTKEAAMGEGFDRHLFGLKHIAETEGMPLPELYTDPAYSYINHIILSTSTLSSPAVLLGGFAPVVPDGFGVGYGVQDDSLGCNVTSYPPARDVQEFLRCVKQSFDDIYEVLNDRDPKK
ncbi:carnitine O-palmitoyltransferase 2, mitochondrial [Lingula anatina]|uniref:Carnitine O-palmitoyltransferase 2, mitochondrial n=1 Tax=Lingula anatina TaxID=7574 RepID=A0A2R2MQ02_LINAN|nr:carnitine O-palmitoyltransferase 2, mitochondrial [Lingula anatina]|eukprot:XP_023932320.1 carnitine O-palmitoyltransferase 2, mitochondrial [Lingula anatina]